jgi:hypothetical protein
MDVGRRQSPHGREQEKVYQTPHGMGIPMEIAETGESNTFLLSDSDLSDSENPVNLKKTR